MFFGCICISILFFIWLRLESKDALQVILFVLGSISIIVCLRWKGYRLDSIFGPCWEKLYASCTLLTTRILHKLRMRKMFFCYLDIFPFEVNVTKWTRQVTFEKMVICLEIAAGQIRRVEKYKYNLTLVTNIMDGGAKIKSWICDKQGHLRQKILQLWQI